MKRKTNYWTKPFWLFVVLFFFHTAQAQLDNFTLTVLHDDETCTANGSLTFVVNNTTPDATMLYAVYLLPDTATPIAVLSGNTITGLVAGNYRVVATQSLNGQNGVKQQDVTIGDEIVDLAYFMTGMNEICGNDGQISVITTSGTASQYEIISGPEIRPLQPGNIFSGLPAGTYILRVFDLCGEGLVHEFTLGTSVPGIGFDAFTDLVNCTTLSVSAYLSSGSGFVIKYPVTIQTTVTQASGPPLVFNNTIDDGDSSAAPFSFNMPIELDETYNAHFLATDGCGNAYQGDIELEAPPLLISPDMIQAVGTCNDVRIRIVLIDPVYPVTVDFLVSPPGFDPEVYNPFHPGPFSGSGSGIIYYNPSIPLPAGLYTIQVTDLCGRSAIQSAVIVYENLPGQNAYTSLPGCQIGLGSLELQNSNGISSGQLVSAPSGFPDALPLDLTSFIENNHIAMGNLPEGDYSFNVVDGCNFISSVTIHVTGYQPGVTTTDITPGCTSFGFHFWHTDNLPSKFFWLQKLDPDTNLWCHPVTGNPAPQSSITTTNALFLTNNTTATIQTSGTFRLVKTFQAAGQLQPCAEVLHTFEYETGPKIDRVFAIACNAGTYEAIVEAIGYGPLIYRITTKDGQPFAVNNGTSALFSGLEPAVYNFQVEDACGNILNSLFHVSAPALFAVQPVNLCPGQPGQLAVPGFPSFTYQWWKEGNPANILSTANSLVFPSFNATGDAGLYHVRIMYPNQSSCIDLVLDFTVSASLANPQAGNNGSETYCGPQGVINLFGLLSGTVDNFGQWEETTASGLLNGNLWDSDSAGPGSYHFKYTVAGLCDAVDESVVDITIIELPESPVASAPERVCETGSLPLQSSYIPDATYHWSGPNGFSSSEQNPVIENFSAANAGTYTVDAEVNGCVTEAVSVTVAVLPAPEFSLAAACVEGAFILTASPIGNSFDPAEASYLWTGPENFSFSGNPAIITGLSSGVYSLMVTSPENCESVSSIEIPNTLCGVPKGVSPNGDGDNDNWDLSGLDIRHVKIFNRYGMLIYEKARYVNEWRGQDKHGHELPSATYYYLIELNSGETESGWVYLIRRG